MRSSKPDVSSDRSVKRTLSSVKGGAVAKPRLGIVMRGGCRRARRLDEANRRSTAGGRAEEIQRGRRKPSSKPRGQTMQSADRRRCNRRKIPENVARDGELEKRGVRRGESRNGCLPPAGTFARGEKHCIAYRVHQRFCMPIDTLHTRGIALLKDIY